MTADIASLVDRCLLVSMPGRAPSPKLTDWLNEGLGGVFLYQPNITDMDQLGQLCADLRAAGTELLIAADAEGGDVTPLHPGDASPHPSHLALGAIDDVTLTRSVGLEIGNDLARAGLNLNLAPVADLGNNPASPITGTRAFGAEPSHAGRHAVAYAEGLREAGVAAAGKHFPGLGSAIKSGDLSFPVSPGELTAHLEPFRALIDAGIPALLSSHAIYPELDDQPASFSRKILVDLLREQLGFTGVVVSDSVTAAMVIAQLGSAEAAVRAFVAGADLVCVLGGLVGQRTARDAVVAAVETGRLPVDRLVAAAQRVGDLARAHAKPAAVPVACREWTPELARRMLHIDAPLPLAGLPYVIEFVSRRHGVDGATLLSRLQRLEPTITGVRMTEKTPGLAYAVRAAPADRQLLLVVQDAHLDQRLCSNIAAIVELRPDVVVVGLGAPADAALAPGRYLGTRGGAGPNMDAAAHVLLRR